MRNNSLYVRLLYLYRKISIVVVKIRMRSYRPFPESSNTFDITSLLHKQINTLTPDPTKNNTPLASESMKPHFSEQNVLKVDSKNNQDREIENVGSTESEFSKYLKQTKLSSINHPFMGEKLKKSAWEHIHCSIRYARQGNVALAKLHANIAGHALEEAVHFMKDDEYTKLVYEIEECFEKS